MMVNQDVLVKKDEQARKEFEALPKEEQEKRKKKNAIELKNLWMNSLKINYNFLIIFYNIYSYDKFRNICKRCHW